MTIKIQEISIPKGKRIIAISDIHAHARLLTGLLKKINYSDEDELFIVGDFLSRGPENLATLRLMMDLSRNGNTRVLAGNFEHFYREVFQANDPNNPSRLYKRALWDLKNYNRSLVTDMLDELGVSLMDDPDLNESFKKLIKAFEPEIAFLQNLPDVIYTDHLIFVHAGLPGADPESYRSDDPLTVLKDDAFMEKGLAFSKYVIVGHWPTFNYHEKPSFLPFINHDQMIISIDGGCGTKRDGQLNALLISDELNMEFSIDHYDDFPVKIASDDQRESEVFTFIHFSDSAISILTRDEEKSYVEHVSSRSRLWVPNEHIWRENDVARCNYSDYRLPVKKGEALRVCRKALNGWLVKKAGYYGLYYGGFV